MHRPEALLSEYLSSADAVRSVVEACADPQLNRREASGAWSVRQIVHHLADVEVGDAMRLRQILAHDAPLIVAYDEGQFAARLHYERASATSLAIFAALRASNVSILERISQADWSRLGRHEEQDRYTVEILVRTGIEHDRLHLAQIQRALHTAD